MKQRSRILGLIELLFGIACVVSVIVLAFKNTPAGGGEFVTYSDVRQLMFMSLGIGVAGGIALIEGIRNLVVR